MGLISSAYKFRGWHHGCGARCGLPVLYCKSSSVSSASSVLVLIINLKFIGKITASLGLKLLRPVNRPGNWLCLFHSRRNLSSRMSIEPPAHGSRLIVYQCQLISWRHHFYRFLPETHEQVNGRFFRNLTAYIPPCAPDIWISLPVSVIAFFARGYIVSFIKNSGNPVIANCARFARCRDFCSSRFSYRFAWFYARRDTDSVRRWYFFFLPLVLLWRFRLFLPLPVLVRTAWAGRKSIGASWNHYSSHHP